MTLVKNIIVFGTTLLTTSALCLELPDKIVTENSRDDYFKLCKGEFVELSRDLQAVKPGSSDYLYSRILSLYTKDGQAKINGFLQGLPKEANLISDEDRIIAASYLLYSHSTDFGKIRELLSFTAQSKMVEHSRKITLSYLDEIDGKRFEALKKRIDAFIEIPEIVTLVEVFTLAAQEKNSERILTPFFKYIDQVPDSDPAKYTLLAMKQVAISKYEEMEKITELAKKAYTLCKHDQNHALFYVGLLVFKKHYDEAEKILTEQVQNNEIYFNYFDLLLSHIYFAKNDTEKGSLYKAKAIANRAYFPDDMQAQIDSLGKNEDQFGNIIFFAVLGLAIVFFLMRLKKNKINI